MKRFRYEAFETSPDYFHVWDGKKHVAMICRKGSQYRPVSGDNKLYPSKRAAVLADMSRTDES